MVVLVQAVRHQSNALLLVMLMGAFWGCGSKVEAPQRHASIPAEAVWAGGPDGGSWILCEPLTNNSANRCTVYHEHTGEVVKTGLFVARDTHKAVPRNQLVYDSFDGERIYLIGNRVLDPAAGG
jgi:hypothetical protein